MPIMNTYPATTTEFIAISITNNGVPILDSTAFSVVKRAFPDAGIAGPDSYTTAYSLNGQIGIFVADMAPGIYDIWAQITAMPQIVVRYAGGIILD